MDWGAPYRGLTHSNQIGIEKMPAPTVGIFDTPLNCGIQINSEWLSFILARLEILSDPRAWIGDETTTSAAAHQIDLLLEALATEIECSPPECPECPECPEPEPPPEPPPPELRQSGDCIEWLNPTTGLWQCQLMLTMPALAISDSECDECDECENEDCEDCDECA
jgi:hypothetical protein